MNAKMTRPEDGMAASWTPMIVIVLAQIMMIFNISTLQVSIDGLASSFNASATTVGTAIVTYALVVAAFILLGARVAQMFGALRVFRGTVVLFGVAMAVMALSLNVIMMIVAQVIAGFAAAALVPTLVVLVAANYRGRHQEKALGWLGGAPAMGIVLAFLIAGSLATWVGWRGMFAALAALAVLIYRMSARLSPVASRATVDIDRIGVALAALAILLISMGSENLKSWGVLLATPSAPFTLMDMSPAPVMILIGIFLLQAFFTWSHRRSGAGRTTLIALEVVDTRKERAALFSIFVISALASAITFLIPLYIQVVQGGTSFATAVAVIPFSIASFAAAVLVVRLYGRVSPNRIARSSFMLVAIGLVMLGATIRNDWSDGMVMLSMAIAGLGEGALVTLLFNVLVTASPPKLAGDVGSIRGATNNLATAVGTALASALVIGLLGARVHENLVHNEAIPHELKAQVNLDDVSFISNDLLRQRLAQTTATSEQVAEAVRINTEARLLSLKLAFFTFAGFALLAYFPVGALPGYVGSKEVERAAAEESPLNPAAPTAR